jgi:hypothetical protein
MQNDISKSKMKNTVFPACRDSAILIFDIFILADIRDTIYEL